MREACAFFMDKEELYDSHLQEWHHIEVEKERKFVILRTKETSRPVEPDCDITIEDDDPFFMENNSQTEHGSNEMKVCFVKLNKLKCILEEVPSLLVQSSEESFTPSPVASNTNLVELPWYESSWHDCLECHKMTTRASFFTSHVQEHEMTKKQYLEKYPSDRLKKIPKWICGVCSKTMSWSARSIVTHLTKFHSMSKDQYEMLYINKQRRSEEIMLEGEPQIQELDISPQVEY